MKNRRFTLFFLAVSVMVANGANAGTQPTESTTQESGSLTQMRERLKHSDRQDRHEFFNKAKNKWRRFSAEEKDAFRKEIKSQLAYGRNRDEAPKRDVNQ